MSTTGAKSLRWAIGHPMVAMGMVFLLAGSCAGTGSQVTPPRTPMPVSVPATSGEIAPKRTVSPAGAAGAGIPTAAAATPAPTLPALSSGLPGTGIEGLVTIGPTCPSETRGSPCSDALFAATVSVRDSAGNEVARFTSGDDGRFRVDLSPGTYTLVPINPNPIPGIPPRGAQQTVTVVDGSVTPVLVKYDSGIR